MKIKTISAIALTASSAFALIGPDPLDLKNICLQTHEDVDGVLSAVSCDETQNNKNGRLKILSNGCAEGQISLIDTKSKKEKKFRFNIPNCLPPHLIQL